MAEFKNELILQDASGVKVSIDLRNALVLSDAPTTATKARVGMQAYVVSGGTITEEYVCTAVSGSTYTWVKREVSGGGSFEATYGETPYSEIRAAYEAGKTVTLVHGRKVYVLSGVLDSMMQFSNQNSLSYSRITVSDTGQWSENANTLENDANKVEIIDESATDTQYPSAKAVRDYVAANGGGGGNENIKLPDYWEGHITEKIETIRTLQRSGGKDCYSFAVLTDYHHPSNAGYSPALIKKVADACNIKFCLCLGDTQTGAAVENKGDVVIGWEEIHDIFTPIRKMTLFTAGNHDGAYGRYDTNGDGEIAGVDEFYVYNYTREEIYDTIFRQVGLIDGVIFNDTCDGYYVDDTVHKVRYLLLNSQWSVYEEDENGLAVNNLMRRCRFGQNQQDFAINALKTVPDNDWTVIFGCHMPICKFPGDGGGGDLSLFREVLSAYQTRSKYSGTYGNVGDYDYVSVNVDFADAKGRVAVALAGHMHNDLLNTDYPFPIVTIAADNYTSFKDLEGGGITAPGELGTITEQAFDVMTVDKRSGVINATRIGKGSDRVISMGDAYIIELKIDNAKASNNIKHILKNGTYTNTITANTGFKIVSATVTMGGVDITETAYSNGVINIPTVTGNIVVSVVTDQLYTNLADPTSEDWYTDSHKLDSDTGEVVAVTNSAYNKKLFVSNFIPLVKDDILRFKGVDREAGVEGSSPRIVWYDENMEITGSLKMDTQNAGTAAGLPVSVTEDENGVAEYTILIRGDTNEQFVYKDACYKVRYARFSAHYKDTVDDIIITVNDEIV